MAIESFSHLLEGFLDPIELSKGHRGELEPLGRGALAPFARKESSEAEVHILQSFAEATVGPLDA